MGEMIFDNPQGKVKHTYKKTLSKDIYTLHGHKLRFLKELETQGE